jgi:hypothetical protein
MMKATMGMSQQKKAMMKQRVMSSVSILLISPYLTIRIVPRAAIPTTTTDHPRISHLKKSDNENPFSNKVQIEEEIFEIWNFEGEYE